MQEAELTSYNEKPYMVIVNSLFGRVMLSQSASTFNIRHKNFRPPLSSFVCQALQYKT